MSKYRERLPGVAITVPGRHLSAFINEPIDLIKMDIEGSEQVVLNELEASGALERVGNVFTWNIIIIFATLWIRCLMCSHYWSATVLGIRSKPIRDAGPPQQHFRTSRFSLIKTNFYQTRPRC